MALHWYNKYDVIGTCIGTAQLASLVLGPVGSNVSPETLLSFSTSSLSSLEFIDSKVYEPYIRARLGTPFGGPVGSNVGSESRMFSEIRDRGDSESSKDLRVSSFGLRVSLIWLSRFPHCHWQL